MTQLPRESRPHPEYRRWLAPVKVLFDGADSGAFDLTEDYDLNRTCLDNLQTAIDALGELPDLKAVEAAVAIRTAQAAGKKPIAKPEIVGKALLDAEAKHEQLTASLHVLRQAQTRAAIALSNLLSDSAEQVVVECLRPAMEQALKDAEAIVPKLGGVRSRRELLAADGIEAKREAWLALESLAVRWKAIRAAYSELFKAGLSGDLGVNVIDAETLLSYSNFDELQRNRERKIDAPSELAVFVVWLVTGEPGGVVPQPWLPLASEAHDAVLAARERNRAKQAAGQAQVQGRRAAAARKENQEQEERDTKTTPAWSQ